MSARSLRAELLMESGGPVDDETLPDFEGSLTANPGIPSRLWPKRFTDDDYQPVHLKEISQYRLDWRAVCRDLRAENRVLLATHIEALADLKKFESAFVEHETLMREARRSTLSDSIFAEAVKNGILRRLPKRMRVVASARLKAVPDRKKPELGRLIYPCLKFNDACKRPEPTPLPKIPDLIENLLHKRWAWSCDIKSWFYHFEVAEEVAAKYFTTRDGGGRRYGHVRAAMGWKWMPYLACSTAQYVLSRCMDSESYGTVWIDDVICASRTKEHALAAKRRFIEACRRYRIEIRDMTDVCERITAVGLEIDLRGKRWRLSEKWTAKACQKWESMDVVRAVRADALWSMAGNVVWGSYAGGLPLWSVLDGVRYACREGARAMDDGRRSRLVSLPRTVRDAFRSMMLTIGKNEWRQLPVRPKPEDAIVTDASFQGLGMIYPYDRGVRIMSRRLPDDVRGEHINVLEVEAVTEAVKKLKPGHYWVVTDNTSVYYDIQSGLGAPSMIPSLLRLQQALKQHGVSLHPLWLRTQHMAEHGADKASREGRDICEYRRGRGCLRTCVNLAKEDTKTLGTRRGLPATVMSNMLGSRETTRVDWLRVLKSALEEQPKYGGPVVLKPREKSGRNIRQGDQRSARGCDV